ncbi:MAG: hypothetical protein AB8E82_05135 [Aureispira sp.]
MSITNYLYKLLPIWLLTGILLSVSVPCMGAVIPPPAKANKQKKAVVHQQKRTRLSFKQPAYYHKKPLDYRQPQKAPNKIVCEGPDMGETIGILLLILLAWAVPTGILVLLGLLLGITWLWILGLVLFLIPVVFGILLIIIALS